MNEWSSGSSFDLGGPFLHQGSEFGDVFRPCAHSGEGLVVWKSRGQRKRLGANARAPPFPVGWTLSVPGHKHVASDSVAQGRVPQLHWAHFLHPEQGTYPLLKWVLWGCSCEPVGGQCYMRISQWPSDPGWGLPGWDGTLLVSGLSWAFLASMSSYAGRVVLIKIKWEKAPNDVSGARLALPPRGTLPATKLTFLRPAQHSAFFF